MIVWLQERKACSNRPRDRTAEKARKIAAETTSDCSAEAPQSRTTPVSPLARRKLSVSSQMERQTTSRVNRRASHPTRWNNGKGRERTDVPGLPGELSVGSSSTSGKLPFSDVPE